MVNFFGATTGLLHIYPNMCYNKGLHYTTISKAGSVDLNYSIIFMNFKGVTSSSVAAKTIWVSIKNAI